ncbi:MAG TPA: hypothetical protein PKB03_00685 [Baekduia sp.]|nr:hypothetical protein [Baekduia sp.]
MTTEQLEATLYKARDAANRRVTELAIVELQEGEEHGAMIDEALAVGHATEIALGMLSTRYIPKREALEDAREMLDRLA